MAWREVRVGPLAGHPCAPGSSQEFSTESAPGALRRLPRRALAAQAARPTDPEKSNAETRPRPAAAPFILKVTFGAEAAGCPVTLTSRVSIAIQATATATQPRPWVDTPFPPTYNRRSL